MLTAKFADGASLSSAILSSSVGSLLLALVVGGAFALTPFLLLSFSFSGHIVVYESEGRVGEMVLFLLL